MRLAVVGHVEWVEFASVDDFPRPGEIVHATETWAEAAGGGGVAAVQLAKLAGAATLFTSFGDDELGRRARAQLTSQGVTVRAMVDPSPQRRAFCLVDGTGERTITVLGDKLRPQGGDTRLPWSELAGMDAVFFVSGDVEALRRSRDARLLLATARELSTLVRGGVRLDVLVGSAADQGERYQPGDLEPAPELVVTTSGPLGGWAQPGGPFRAAPLTGPVVDAYGCGDSFAAGLAFALARGDGQEEAIAFAAKCGAAVLTGRGPYEGQLVLEPSERGMPG
jgi:ribokinase